MSYQRVDRVLNAFVSGATAGLDSAALERLSQAIASSLAELAIPPIFRRPQV